MTTPRYEVIADYPKSHFVVGQILRLEKSGKHFRYVWYEYDGKDWMYQDELEEYPHIFKKLND